MSDPREFSAEDVLKIKMQMSAQIFNLQVERDALRTENERLKSSFQSREAEIVAAQMLLRQEQLQSEREKVNQAVYEMDKAKADRDKYINLEREKVTRLRSALWNVRQWLCQHGTCRCDSEVGYVCVDCACETEARSVLAEIGDEK
jgi:hypothetical protein